MEIVFFYQYFGTPRGSWSTRVYEITKRWVDAGYKVTVITAPYDKSDIVTKSFITKDVIDGINLIIINAGDSNRFSKVKRVYRSLLFSLISIWYAVTLKYDICIASSGPITIGFPLIFAKKIRNKKTVFEVRDLWPAGAIELDIIKMNWQKRIALWFEKVCYNSACLIITASIGQKEYISKRFPEKNIEVIPNASDVALFNRKITTSLPGWTKGKVLFTHIGSLGLIHNIDYWMKVAKEIKILDNEERIKFIFIGDGVDKERLINIKHKYNLKNVHFLGLMPKNDLPIWVQNSKATLFATLDNFVQSTCSPNKIFDSFAAGVPIIQTTKGWIREIVNKENVGINIDLEFPKKAAQDILDMSKTNNQEMKHNAFRLAMNDFNRDLLSQKYLKFLLELKDEKCNHNRK